MALGRLVRLHYTQRLAAAGHGAAPGGEELKSAQDALSEAVGRSVEATSVGAAADGARRILARGGYVFIPLPDDDPGLALARGEERVTGLTRVVWDRTVHYRRVGYRGTVIPSFAAFAAARLGKPALATLGSHAGPTVFLDRAAIERAAGRGPFARDDAARLATLVEVDQAVQLWLGKHDPAEWRVGDDAPARWRAVALLAAVAQAGDPQPRELLRALAARPAGLGVGTRPAARVVLAGLGEGPFAAAAERCYRALQTPTGFAAARARALASAPARRRRQ